MTYYDYLVKNYEILINLNQNGYKDEDLYYKKIYEKFLEMRPMFDSIKATMLTMEQQGYGSFSNIKRIRKRMEKNMD